MRALLCVLLASACALADDSEDRRSKLPYIADAVGNTLPPPSGGPATVGSPVNLLTPDRYEFYTFDESGELVKRLMTLEEIQAIVAAGEETEGLVTFANENQPTIAFNFSQPPYTKVHNVVTNVQNVLKAQMEAHKNKPPTQPTLDTPDVSDSWSLILPSIFGNTGVDIVPDKISGTFTTPETETIEIARPIDDNSLSKEGSSQILSTSSTTAKESIKEIPVTEKILSTTEKLKLSSTTSTTTTTTTTQKPTTTTTTTTTPKPTITTLRPTTTRKVTTARPRTTTSTTIRPRPSKTTNKPRTTVTEATTKIFKTTTKPTTVKPNPTTTKLNPPTKNPTTQKYSEGNFTRIQIQTQSNKVSTTEKSTIKYEKISTFSPLSTAAYVTERSTQRPTQATKAPVASTTKILVPSSTRTTSSTTTKSQPSVTTYKPPINTAAYISSTVNEENDKFNGTTMTTQSVSPSTTVSSTEFISIGPHTNSVSKMPSSNLNKDDIKPNEQELPLFDISQSISQIASDLGSDYQPLPTSSDLLDTTKVNDMNLESKENIEIDIPSEDVKESDIKTSNLNNENDKPIDNFVKISTLDPHSQTENKILIKDTNKNVETKTTTENIVITTLKADTTTSTTTTPFSTTIDPIISDSMDDLLSQVVNQASQSIIDPEKSSEKEDKKPVNKEKSTTAAPENIVSTTEKSEDKSEITKAKEKITMPNISSKDDSVLANKMEEKVNKISEKEKIQETININDLEKETEKKQNLLNPIENTVNMEKKNELTTEASISKPIEVREKNETTIKLSTSKPQENNDIVIKPKPGGSKTETPIKGNNNTQTNTSKEDDVKTTTSTETPQKIETTKKPFSSTTKKVEISVPSVNKIVSSENNKIVNKEKDKLTDGSGLLPKVDEFKKKIQKVNIDDKELANDRNNSWKLISTVSPPKANEISKEKLKTDNQESSDKDIVLEFSKENQGLEVTTKDLGEDIAQFTELCNELAFRYWHAMIETIDKRRSFVLSPYSITSMLAMMFMGARGATSGEMNEILKLDDMVTFNPHFTLKNISDSIETTPAAGVIVSAFIRELFSDRSKGKVLTFYKERAQHFYNGHVEEINFKLISDIIRRRTNLLVKRYSWGLIPEYMKANTINMQPPLAAFSANIFQTDCSGSSVEGRDGEMYFVVSPNVRQRRLVPVPAVVYRNGFLAGYDPVLDATAAALGNTNSVISTLFLMPGQQGNVVHAEDLEALEKRLLESNPTTPVWKGLLRTLLPRMGLELQIPRFSHKSLFNVSTTLKRMGLKELFDPDHADLGGLNGPSKDLYLSDMVQSTTFVTCGEGVVGEQHHIEEYPESLSGPQRRRTSRWVNGWDEPRDYQRAFHDPHDVGEAMHLPLHLRPRQARLPARNAQPARLKFDRPFLYFVRHNPSGMILYVGRYNPRLLP